METLRLLDWRTLVFVIPVAFAALLALGAALGVFTAEPGDAADGEGGDGAADPGLLLGLGRLPVTVSVMLVAFTFGGIGLIVGPLVRAVVPGSPLAGGLAAVGVALGGAVLVSGRLAWLLARRAPLFESETVSRADLVGTGGRLVVAASAEAVGLAQVRDRRGNLHRVPCKTELGEPSLRAGTEVLIVHYDDSTSTYIVTPNPLV